MSKITDVMTRGVEVIRPGDSVQQAAEKMESLNVGSLPVCDGKRILGMITDRDIVVRSTAKGNAPGECKVEDVMTRDIKYCTEDEDTADVMQMMGEQQIRRLPVIDDEKSLIGIVSLGDMATRQSAHIDKTVRQISAP